MALFFLLAELINLEEQQENRRLSHRMRSSFFRRPLTDIEFVRNFRISRTVFELLCEEVIPLLPPKRRSNAIEPVIKVLSALSFYGKGSYHGVISTAAPMSQPTFSRCLRQVTSVLSSPHFTKKYMRFPQNQAERNNIKSRFLQKFGLPGVCGCIGCTHISIVKPSEAEERFSNSKKFHSLNVQLICDERCRILNVDARHGGATHDAHIWQNNSLHGHFEELARTGERAYLLGDSAYPLREFMMTPVENALPASPEANFNAKHSEAHSTIGRTFGILKGRWQCLLASNKLHYYPEVAGKVMIACCVLHNICIANNVKILKLTKEESETEHNLQPNIDASVNTNTTAIRRGQTVRQQLILNNSINI